MEGKVREIQSRNKMQFLEVMVVKQQVLDFRVESDFSHS